MFPLKAALAEDLIRIYWSELYQRIKGCALPKGTWLDELYSVAETARIIEEAQRSGQKNTVALWGPSQTGKSTLLSSYIDLGADEDGRGSALHWGNIPVRFSGAHEEGRLVFNPYNSKADASGCITRFVLADETSTQVEAANPVRIRLVSRKQLLHALAAGFVSECASGNDEVGRTAWTADKLSQYVENVADSEEEPDQVAYERLREVLDVLDDLRALNDLRYSSLGRDDVLRFRRAALGHRGLLASVQEVEMLASTLFWDRWDSVTEAFDELCAYLNRTQKLLSSPTDELRCSMEVAALVLNIQSYENLVKRVPEVEKVVRSMVSARLPDGRVAINARPNPRLSSSPLFPPERERDFALFQGIVWELVVPLNATRLKAAAQNSAATDDATKRSVASILDLLEVSDVIDFPGTSNQDTASQEALIKAETLVKGGKDAHLLFTAVLKRGKTSSIVFSSGRNLQIDGFSILCRARESPGKPDVLASAVKAWWFSLTGRPLASSVKPRELPLNLVVTFFGGLAAEIISRETLRKAGTSVKSNLDRMQPLSDTRYASFFTVTYKISGVADGPIQIAKDSHREATDKEKHRFFDDLKNDEEFASFFFRDPQEPSGERSVSETLFAPDGGTNILLEKLRLDAMNSERGAKVKERREETEERWNRLLNSNQLLPPAPDAGNAARATRIGEWQKSLGRKLVDSDPTGWRSIGSALRRFLLIEAAEIAEIPREVTERNGFNGEAFLDTITSAWEIREITPTDRDTLGFADEAKVAEFRSDLGSYLTATFAGELAGWMRQNFSHAAGDYRKREALTRYVATWLNDRLLGTHATRAKGYEGMSEKLVHKLFAATDIDKPTELKESAHWKNVFKPFIDQLDQVKKAGVDTRGFQVGDQELRRLLHLPG